MLNYKRMTFTERMNIFKFLYVEKLKPSRIAKLLNRNLSSITREISKGIDKNGLYNPLVAEVRHLEAKKKQRPHLKMTEEAWKLVRAKLELNWSPEQIAKWLRREYPEYSMCAKTIYNYMLSCMKEKKDE